MTTPREPAETPDAAPPAAFALAEEAAPAEERRRADLIEYLFPRTVSARADDEFWTNRPYKPNAREAQLITLTLGILGVLILGTTVWFPVFLTCAGAIGLTSIMAGTILTLGRYENPWWRLPGLLAIVCGVIDLAGVAAWLSSR
jgi:hypothetical protein